jgi:hypothetical protein
MASKLNPDLLRDVRTLLAAFMGPREIQVRMAAKYKLTERTVRKYLRIAKEEESEEGRLTRAERRERLANTLQQIIRSSLFAKKFTAAVAATDKLAKLWGCYAPVEANIQHTLEGRVDMMTTDQKRARLNELFGLSEERARVEGAN